MNPHNLKRGLEDGELDQDGKALLVPGYGYLVGWGLVVPADASTGWAIGAIYHHLDGGNATSAYLNEGTADSCDFNAIIVA